MDDVSAVLARLGLGEADDSEEEQRPSAPAARIGPRPSRQQGIIIGGQHFQTVHAVWDHIAVVKRRLLGRCVRPGDPDFEFLLGLLARHPRGAAKVENPPVREFTARTNTSGRGIEFLFVDSMGEEHDFSAKKCMDQRDEPLGSKLRRAMELAVQKQAEAFRTGAGAGAACELCGSTAPGLRVDCYDPHLLQLCADFLEAHPTLQPPMQFAESPSGGAQFRLEDASFEAAWRSYHGSHANLRLLCEDCEAQENVRRHVRTKGAVLGSSRYGRGRGGSQTGRGRAYGRGGRRPVM